MTQTVVIKMDEYYDGVSVDGKPKSFNSRTLDGNVGHAIIPAVYVVPFFVTFIGLVVLICILYRRCKGEKSSYSKIINDAPSVGVDWESSDDVKHKFMFMENLKLVLEKFAMKVKQDLRLKSNLVATAFICFYFGIFVFIMDMISTGIEGDGDHLPSYFKRKECLFWIFIVSSIISLLFNVIGLILLITFFFYGTKDESAADDEGKKTADDKGIKKMYLGYIAMTFCCGSTIMFLSFHFQNILIAWCIVPFYAGRIVLHYGVVLFILFLVLKYTFKYTFILFQDDHKNVSKCNRGLILAVLFVTSVFVMGTITTIAIFIVDIPISNSIEDTAIGITTIYNGAVLLIGTLIAYNVGGHYFGGSFSVNTVLNRAMRGIKNNPFDESDDKEWRTESEEMRMCKIVQKLIKQYPKSINNKSDDNPKQAKEVVKGTGGTGEVTSPLELEVEAQKLPK